MKKLWLRQGRALVLLAVCGGIFGSCFALYHLPLRAVAYPCALCALVLLGAGIGEFFTQRQKLKKLAALAGLPDDLTERLEAFEGQPDEAYREIIHNLVQESVEFRSQTRQREQEQKDYYTTWVHQIKTPIASMHLLLENEDSPFGRSVGEELQRIEQYAEMALTYQRMDSVDTDYVFRSCDLDRLVRGAIRRFAAQFIRKGIKLEYTPMEVQVVTDEKWLSFVIEQLLSNALKYTPSGTVAVDWEQGQLCIRDTGIGIAPEDLPRIFDRGYTGSTGRSDRRSSGVGCFCASGFVKIWGMKFALPLCRGREPPSGWAFRIRTGCMNKGCRGDFPRRFP